MLRIKDKVKFGLYPLNLNGGEDTRYELCMPGLDELGLLNKSVGTFEVGNYDKFSIIHYMIRHFTGFPEDAKRLLFRNGAVPV